MLFLSTARGQSSITYFAQARLTVGRGPLDPTAALISELGIEPCLKLRWLQ